MSQPDSPHSAPVTATRRDPSRPPAPVMPLLTALVMVIGLGACDVNPVTGANPTPASTPGTSSSPTAAPAATATPSATATPVPSRTWRALGYHTGTQASLDSLTAREDLLSDVSCDLWSFTSNGNLDNSDLPQDVLDLAVAHPLRVWACISNYANGDFDQPLGHQVLVTAKTAALSALVQLAETGNFAGINLDMENIAATDRAAYTTFVTELASALHAKGRLLMLSVPAKEGDDPTDSWSGAFDYAALGGLADYIQLMTYDENGTWGSPGPVSGADWFGSCITYAASVIAPDKLLGGLPAYGYDWDLDATASLDNSGMPEWTSFAALIAQATATTWDSASSSPWLTYVDTSGHHHTVWYENAASITAKTKLCRSANLGGVAVWCLGNEDAAYWTAVSTGWN